MSSFNDIEPLRMAMLGANKASEAPDCVIVHQGDGMLILSLLEARALRDWLSLALPPTEERSPVEPSERFPCPDCGGTGNRPELRAALKASAPVYNCPVTHVDCIRNCAPTRCAIADTP